MSIYSAFQKIYHKLQDEKSRNIFLNRFNRYITQDDRYLFVENNDKIANILFHHDPNIPIIIYGKQNIRSCIYKLLSKFISVQCFCEDKIKKNRFHFGLPVISINELITKYNNSIVLLLSNDANKKVIYTLLTHGFKKEQIIIFERSGIEYFDLPCFMSGKNEIFVDAGGYDGDTIIEFRKWCKYNYKKIYVIEPDSKNVERLKNTIVNENIANIHLCEKGVWSKKGYLHFNSDGNIGSKISSKGKSIIKVDTIDNIVGGDPVTFIKLDVEGAELEALKGAKNTIEKNKPRIAVCIYHKPDDFIEIPLYIINNFPYYKLFIRKYNYDWYPYDTILYAIKY